MNKETGRKGGKCVCFLLSCLGVSNKEACPFLLDKAGKWTKDSVAMLSSVVKRNLCMQELLTVEGVWVFIDNDLEYQKWRDKNSSGYVLNAGRKPRSKYLQLHKASCGFLKDYGQLPAGENPATGSYLKACAHRPEPLLAWIRQFGAQEFTTLCSGKNCQPSISMADKLAVENLYFQQEVERLIKKPQELAISLRLETGIPDFRTVEVTVFNRSAAVVATTLQRAQGKCESCSNPAPFLRAGNGTPYLEVHHKVPLAQGGMDIVTNAEALCPNCHRRKHFGNEV